MVHAVRRDVEKHLYVHKEVIMLLTDRNNIQYSGLLHPKQVSNQEDARQKLN